MAEDLHEMARRFMQSLGPRKDPDYCQLDDLLTADEMEAIKACVKKYSYRQIAEFASLRVTDPSKRVPPLAQLQLLIGLGEGSVSEQVCEAVKEEMSRRDWVWHSYRGDGKQTPLAKESGVSKSQIHRFLKGGEYGVIKTSTLDRISQVVPLEVITWGELGRVYDALAPLKPGFRRDVLRDDTIEEDQEAGTEAVAAPGGTVTQQIRLTLGEVMRRRGWSQKKLACWTGVSQSQICRFLSGGELKTVALDQIGAFLWVEIVRSTKVSQTK